METMTSAAIIVGLFLLEINGGIANPVRRDYANRSRQVLQAQ